MRARAGWYSSITAQTLKYRSPLRAREDVVATAGREADHDLDRLLRIVGLRQRAAQPLGKIAVILYKQKTHGLSIWARFRQASLRIITDSFDCN